MNNVPRNFSIIFYHNYKTIDIVNRSNGMDIHVIARKRLGLSKVSDLIWDSAAWAVSDNTAKALVGGKIYLHETQSSPAYLGGEIISYEIDGAIFPSRKVFRFKYDPKCKGVTTPKSGWSQEKKII
jgi:hypothetical protein